jgi:hypothetical protein
LKLSRPIGPRVCRLGNTCQCFVGLLFLFERTLKQAGLLGLADDLGEADRNNVILLFCSLSVFFPNIGSALKRFSSFRTSTRCGTFNHFFTHIRCDALAFGTHYAVYDPVLPVWPIGDISLHRLRLDLHYPKSLFSSCPSR